MPRQPLRRPGGSVSLEFEPLTSRLSGGRSWPGYGVVRAMADIRSLLTTDMVSQQGYPLRQRTVVTMVKGEVTKLARSGERS